MDKNIAQLSVPFMRLIAELNLAIQYCKHGFAYMEFEYKNVFPPARNVDHDLALDIAMQNFKHEHQQFFELLCNNLPLILETKTAIDELIAKLERCKDNFTAMEDILFDVNQYGVIDHYWAMAIAMLNLRRPYWYMEWACDNARHYLMTQRQQVVSPNANAVQSTAAEPVAVNFSEEHNNAAIPEGTAENNTAEREEMVEGNSNTSASEVTVENNLHQLALDPNKKD